MGWSTIRMENCQSWKDEVFSLDKGLTVIEGMSEVGKSVFVKCIRLGLAYDQYTPRKRKSIVRNWHSNNVEPAKFTIVTDEGYLVQFTFNLTNMTTREISPEGETRYYKGPADEQTIKILQLITTGNRVMNILDNESPMLLDGTDPKYNDSVLGDFITHRELELMSETAASNVVYYREKIKRAKREVNYNNAKLADIPEVGDLIWVKDNMENIRSIDKRLTGMSEVMQRLVNVDKEDREDVRTVDVGNIEEAYRQQKLIHKLLTHLKPYFEDKPVMTNLIGIVEESAKEMKALSKAIEMVVKINNTEYSETTEEEELHKMSRRMVDMVTMIRRVAELVCADEVHKVDNKIVEEAELMREEMERKNRVLDLVCRIKENYTRAHEVEVEGNNLLELKNLIYEQLGVCPLCDNILRKES